MLWKRAVMIGMAGLLALAVAGVPGLGPSAGKGEARAAEFATSPLTVVTARGRFPFTVEMAVTREQLEQGLQYRQSLAADAGMLFDFGRSEPVAMWMLNTPIPLDMVFIDQAGRVTQVVEHTTPYSLHVISSEGPVRAVLEIAAGTAERLAITKGSRILHPPLFGHR